MKIKYKILVAVIALVTLFYMVLSTINLIFNKKYAVQEISSTARKEGLIGIEELISADYLQVIYANLFYALVIIGFTIVILASNRIVKPK